MFKSLFFFVLLLWQSLCRLLAMLGCLRLLGLFFILVSINCHAALQDPTQPANFNPANIASTLGKGLIVDAIFYSPAEQHAIINGQTLRQGDSILAFKLLQIKPQAIVLTGPSGVFEMPMLNLQVKQAATDGVRTQ